MATVIDLDQIKTLVTDLDVVAAMEEGFIQYSNGNTVVPPVGELLFEKPKGDVHLKYGYIKNDDYYVIKIASGFYENPKLGLPSSQGMMLLFDQKTGIPKAILLDEGFLTDIRTAAAGALAAKYFAPKEISSIGILGTGIQARLQLEYLQFHTPCKEVCVWGRKAENVDRFVAHFKKEFNVQVAESPAEVAQTANLIVTTTPSEVPLLQAEDIREGTHITAVGSDTEHKQELASGVLQKADLVIADSIPQSKSRGEVYRAVQDGVIEAATVTELGTVIQQPNLQRTSDQQISVVDLTGVAVQDIMISKAIFQQYINQ